jgi:SAM-dependent methyltransferase
MNCPLCAHDRSGPSWVGATTHGGRTFTYVECLSCRSLYCDPMPDAETLARMYGPDYAASFHEDPAIEDPKEAPRVVRWLEQHPEAGTFLDYGCGSGLLLTEAAQRGWRAIGVELDAGVAEAVAQRTGAMVVSRPAELPAGVADVVHLGDVIEHLTEMDRVLPEVLRLIKPGGLLLAQGPLENNASLFTAVLRAVKSVRGGKPAEMAPYHVMLATSAGQRRLFARLGLQEVEYTLREVAWPAPSRLAVSDLLRPRALALYTVRRLSQAASALRPRAWGNRYFYAGRKP